MHDIRFDIVTAMTELEGEAVLGQALLFPEITRLADTAERCQKAIQKAAAELYEALPAQALSCRHVPGEVRCQQVTVSLTPPARTPAWTEPVELTLAALRWRHGETALAYVLALDLTVLARDEAALDAALRREILAALQQSGQARSLAALAALPRGGDVELRRHEVVAIRPTLKEDAQTEWQNAHGGSAAETKILREVATDLLTSEREPTFGMDAQIEQVAERLRPPQNESVLLVGEPAVGKTALWQELVTRRRLIGLSRTEFWATSGARLVAGMSGFGMWQERCQQLCFELEKRDAVLHVGNLAELCEVGQSLHQKQSIAQFLRPFIGRGQIRVIAECTPLERARIERDEPGLWAVFTPVVIASPSEAEAEAIIAAWADDQLKKKRVLLDADALATAGRLHRRWSPYSAHPGRALRFLRHLVADAQGEELFGERHVIDCFTRETGLPAFMLHDDMPYDIVHARAWFSARVKGQAAAVNDVVDIIATVKAELGRPRRPLASLLFVGPTGVGKTELAKALAEHLFGHREKLCRFDMSEYNDAYAVKRLIGGVDGEGLLTARVREQPFGVLLLDELEKADGLFLDLLLQVLGEGRLTDDAGRVASFANTVIIMTSNLGAEAMRSRPVGFGEGRDPSALQQHYQAAVRGFFRPELCNRFDRVIGFEPLDPAMLRDIAARQLGQIEQRDGLAWRGVRLTVGPDVAAWLADTAADPRYGARPLRRKIERELLAPLAGELNRYNAEQPVQAEVSLADGALSVSAKGVPNKAGTPGEPQRPGSSEALVEPVKRCQALRREAQQAMLCSALAQLDSELFRLGRIEQSVQQRQARGRKPSHQDLAALLPLGRMRTVRRELGQAWEHVCALEEEALLALLGEAPNDAGTAAQRLTGAQVDAARAWFLAMLGFFGLQFESPNRAVLMLSGFDVKSLHRLAEAYHQVLGAWADTQVRLHQVTMGGRGQPPKLEAVKRVEAFFAAHDPETTAVLFELEGPHVLSRLVSESGVHRLQRDGQWHEGEVHCIDKPLADIALPGPARVKPAAKSSRRDYQLDARLVQDTVTGGQYRFGGRRLADALALAQEASVRRAIASLICE